jgi:hypothetical protein
MPRLHRGMPFLYHVTHKKSDPRWVSQICNRCSLLLVIKASMRRVSDNDLAANSSMKFGLPPSDAVGID